MMDYDRIYERVVRRGDEILEQRRKKAVKIRQTSYAVSGVCAAVITGVGIWRLTDSKNIPQPANSGIEVFSDTTDEKTATTTIPEFSAETTAKSKGTSTTSTKANSTATTLTSSSVTTRNATENIQTALSSASVNVTQTTSRSDSVSVNVTQTTSNSESVSVNVTQTTSENTPVSTEVYTEVAAISTTRATSGNQNTNTSANQETAESYPKEKKAPENTSLYSKITLNSHDESTEQMAQETTFTYNKSTVEFRNVGRLIERIHVTGRYYDGTEYIDTETDAEIYEIKGYSPDVFAAVKFEGSDEYYLYFNRQYQPATLEELISTFNLNANDIRKNCMYDQRTIENIDTEKAWEFLTEDTSLPNIKEECDEKGISVRMRLRFFINSPDKPWLSGSFVIDSRGYIWTDINPIGSYYYIGWEKAREIILYFTK